MRKQFEVFQVNWSSNYNALINLIQMLDILFSLVLLISYFISWRFQSFNCVFPTFNLKSPGAVIGSEDCLHLAVHTPELPSADHNPKLPVMVRFLKAQDNLYHNIKVLVVVCI